MNRRDLLKSGISAMGLAALAGCDVLGGETGPSHKGAGAVGDALVQPFSAPLAPIHSSPDRVTRTIVGLRPFRRTGARLETERVVGKDVVHNYGHGGGGVSLSWGVAEMAAKMAKSYGRRDIAILGAGAIGLSTALELQRAGARVTIYAASFPPYTTSNVAGAMWHPVTLYKDSDVSAETKAMLHQASRIAFQRFVRYANAPRYGVIWIRQFLASDKPLPTDEPYMGGDDLYPGMARNQPGPGPFGFKFWDGYYTLMIDSDIYMRALVNDFMSAGGQMVERVFEDREDLAALDQKTIVNCMGLGAGCYVAKLTAICSKQPRSFE